MFRQFSNNEKNNKELPAKTRIFCFSRLPYPCVKNDIYFMRAKNP